MRKVTSHCAYCNEWKILTREHVIPRSKGGKIIFWVCSTCNQDKANLSLENWISILSIDAPQRIYAARFVTMSISDIQAFAKAQLQSMVFQCPQFNTLTFPLLTWKISGARICFSDGYQCWNQDVVEERQGSSLPPLSEHNYYDAKSFHRIQWIIGKNTFTSSPTIWKRKKKASFSFSSFMDILRSEYREQRQQMKAKEIKLILNFVLFKTKLYFSFLEEIPTSSSRKKPKNSAD